VIEINHVTFIFRLKKISIKLIEKFLSDEGKYLFCKTY
jgi:hypothetical protein